MIPSGAQVKAGRVVALAITSSMRSPLLPDVPTAAEAGFPGVEFAATFGMNCISLDELDSARPEFERKRAGAASAPARQNAVFCGLLLRLLVGIDHVAGLEIGGREDGLGVHAAV